MPLVVVEYHVIRLAHHVVARLLDSLLQRKEFALVGARVVHLALAGRSTHQVRVNAKGEAQSVRSLRHVVAPVATLLLRGIVERYDAHHAVLLAVGVYVVAADHRFAGVLDTRHEVDDVLLLLLLALSALLLVRDHLVVAHVIPVVVVHLNLHPWSRRVLNHVAFADAYQTIDVEPRVAEYRRVVRHGVCLRARRCHTAHDGEFAVFCRLASQTRLWVGFSTHAHQEVS